jgi:hypothetical protein
VSKFTSHGWWCGPGMPPPDMPVPAMVARCGGPGMCSMCHEECVAAIPAADPDRACDHPTFVATVTVNAITETEGGPVVAYMADVRINCGPCGEAMRFTGCPAGLMRDRPAVSPDETELRAPIRPASSDPDFGLGLPGFAVRWTDRPDQQTEGAG